MCAHRERHTPRLTDVSFAEMLPAPVFSGGLARKGILCALLRCYGQSYARNIAKYLITFNIFGLLQSYGVFLMGEGKHLTMRPSAGSHPNLTLSSNIRALSFFFNNFITITKNTLFSLSNQALTLLRQIVRVITAPSTRNSPFPCPFHNIVSLGEIAQSSLKRA
jgi:hypothetical protein